MPYIFKKIDRKGTNFMRDEEIVSDFLIYEL